MGLFDFLTGASNKTPKEYDPYHGGKKMLGKERLLLDSIESWIAAGNLMTQHLDSNQTFLKNFPFTMEKLKMFIFQFENQKFVFESDVKFMAVYWFEVDKNLIGGIKARLFTETIDEVSDYTQKMGEPPEFAGDVILAFCDGRPCISVNNRANKSAAVSSSWFNQNWIDLQIGRKNLSHLHL